MNSWDVKILSYLQGRDWTDPDAVARHVKGKHYGDTWARPRCKRLVRMGYVERNDNGWYRIKDTVNVEHELKQ